MSSTTIAGVVNEIADINRELNSLRKQVRRLNQRKAQLENEILSYMESKDQHGLKYKGMKIEAQEKEVYRRKKKTEKDESAVQTLRQYGIRDAENAYKDLMTAMKGSTQHKFKVKISSYSERKPR